MTAVPARQARADAAWAQYAILCADPAGIAAAEAATAVWRESGNVQPTVAQTARREGWGTADSLAFCAWVCTGKAWLCLYMGDLAESARLCERAESIAAARRPTLGALVPS